MGEHLIGEQRTFESEYSASDRPWQETKLNSET
jgi:hypothetical protein